MKMCSKRILAFLALICMLTLCACGNGSTSSKNEEEAGKAPASLVYEDRMYLTFEQSLIFSTNIIHGEYLGQADGDCGGYVFKVLKQIKGNIEDEQICIHVQPANVCIVNTGIEYIRNPQYTERGTYLLVLQRNVAVYYPHDKYFPLSDICIPLLNVITSKIYGEEPLKEHTEFNMDSSTDSEMLCSYVETYLSSVDYRAPAFYGRDYIHSINFTDVVNGSEHIIKVTIARAKEEIPNFSAIEYECYITKQYKGNVTTDSIDIIIGVGEVVEGNEYILATNSTSIDGLMHLSSKASVFDVSNESDIIELCTENS